MHRLEDKMAKIPLVTHYSFDSEVPVFIFDTEEEALKELKAQFDEELRIQTEENEHVQGEDLEVDVSPDGRWASITIYYDDQKDVVEWSIGTVREVNKDEPDAYTFKGRRDPYKVAQIDKIMNASEFYAYLSGDKTSGAKTINLDGDVLEIVKAFYEGKKITIEEVVK